MKRIILALIAVGALVAPASALAGGVVLKAERGNHLVAVVSGKHVQLVHTIAARRLHTGQRIALHSRRLANGTFAGTKIRVLGRAHRVHFGGLVLARRNHTITVSAAGMPVTMHSTSTAQPGSEVDVDADVNDAGELDATQVDVVTPTAAGGSIEGHIAALGTNSITVGSDGQLLTIAVPSTISLSALKVGDEVLAQFTQQSDGSLLLTSITADQSAAAADDNQGDDNQQSGEDAGGSTSGGSTSGGQTGGDNGSDDGGDGGGSGSDG